MKIQKKCRGWGGVDVNEGLNEVIVKTKEKKSGRGSSRVGGQGVSERRIEIIVKMQNKVGGSGWMCTKN